MEIKERELSIRIQKKLQAGKVLMLLGARRVGKTMLVNELLKKVDEPFLYLNGEDINVHDQLANRSVENYKQIIGSYKLLYIDEAQKIPEIGIKLKLMVDEIAGLKIIITGSSSFDINKNVGEPLTGRKYTFHLFPFSESEYDQSETKINKLQKVKERLVFGNYPELIHIPDKDDKKDYLNEMISSYLLKDILVYENIKNSQKFSTC